MKTKMKMMTPVLAFVATAAVVMQPAMAADKPEVNDKLLAIGDRAYAIECAACHGVEGDGKGPAAHYLNPSPRNFQLGVYKLRSTPNGEVPTDEDLFKTITDGIHNSMMPSFKALSEEQRWALVAVIRRFGGLEDERGEPITVPPRPEATTASIENGMQVYDRLKCGTCHGADGVGEGPSSLTLKNDAKERIYPADITTGVFKGGSSPEDLFTRIATGLDGSPMPSYAAEASPAEIWDLVNYMKSLEKPKS